MTYVGLAAAPGHTMVWIVIHAGLLVHFHNCEISSLGHLLCAAPGSGLCIRGSGSDFVQGGYQEEDCSHNWGAIEKLTSSLHKRGNMCTCRYIYIYMCVFIYLFIYLYVCIGIL